MERENRHFGILFRHKEEQNHVIAGKKVELEIIRLSEISHSQKVILHGFSLTRNCRNGEHCVLMQFVLNNA